MILVDTSAWVEYLRATGTPEDLAVDRLLDADAALACCDPIRMEVLAGARDARHLAELRGLLGRAQTLPLLAVDYESAAAYARTCDPGAAFSAVIQLGTMAAVLIYFRRDIARITVAFVRGLVDRDLRRTPDSLMGWYVAVGTVPVVVFGFAFRHQISSGARSLVLIASVMVVGGVIMLAVDRIAVLQRGMKGVGWRDGIIVGLCQALALVPGVSRSGATIVGGLVLGFDLVGAAVLALAVTGTIS